MLKVNKNSIKKVKAMEKDIEVFSKALKELPKMVSQVSSDLDKPLKGKPSKVELSGFRSKVKTKAMKEAARTPEKALEAKGRARFRLERDAAEIFAPLYAEAMQRLIGSMASLELKPSTLKKKKGLIKKYPNKYKGPAENYGFLSNKMVYSFMYSFTSARGVDPNAPFRIAFPTTGTVYYNLSNPYDKSVKTGAPYVTAILENVSMSLGLDDENLFSGKASRLLSEFYDTNKAKQIASSQYVKILREEFKKARG